MPKKGHIFTVKGHFYGSSLPPCPPPWLKAGGGGIFPPCPPPLNGVPGHKGTQWPYKKRGNHRHKGGGGGEGGSPCHIKGGRHGPSNMVGSITMIVSKNLWSFFSSKFLKGAFPLKEKIEENKVVCLLFSQNAAVKICLYEY